MKQYSPSHSLVASNITLQPLLYYQTLLSIPCSLLNPKPYTLNLRHYSPPLAPSLTQAIMRSLILFFFSCSRILFLKNLATARHELGLVELGLVERT
jgi:hypothetical protein